MKPVFRIEVIRESFRKLMIRFPIEALLSILLTGVIVFVIQTDSHDAWIPHAIYSLIVTFFLSVGMTLCQESKENLRWWRILTGIPLVYGVGFYFVGERLGDGSSEEPILFILHLVGFLAILMIAPYWKKLF